MMSARLAANFPSSQLFSLENMINSSWILLASSSSDSLLILSQKDLFCRSFFFKASMMSDCAWNWRSKWALNSFTCNKSYEARTKITWVYFNKLLFQVFCDLSIIFSFLGRLIQQFIIMDLLKCTVQSVLGFFISSLQFCSDLWSLLFPVCSILLFKCLITLIHFFFIFFHFCDLVLLFFNCDFQLLQLIFFLQLLFLWWWNNGLQLSGNEEYARALHYQHSRAKCLCHLAFSVQVIFLALRLEPNLSKFLSSTTKLLIQTCVGFLCLD